LLNGIKKMNDLISVVVPVFNEERAVASTIKHLKEVMDKSGYDYEVIAVNDGSKDRSQEILNKINGIKVINHPYNLGYSASLKDGIKHAKGNYILITDADGTYPIKEIPNLLEHIDKYDMVVGERRKENVPLLSMIPATTCNRTKTRCCWSSLSTRGENLLIARRTCPSGMGSNGNISPACS